MKKAGVKKAVKAEVVALRNLQISSQYAALGFLVFLVLGCLKTILVVQRGKVVWLAMIYLGVCVWPWGQTHRKILFLLKNDGACRDC